MQAQLSDAQLLRLEQLLAEPELQRAMRLDEAQGYLCSALAGPRPMAADDWLSEILGAGACSSGNAGREAAELLRLFANQLQAELASGDPLMLLLYPAEKNEDAASDYVPWCHAYLHGIDSAREDWFESLGADDDKEDSEEIAYLDEQLFPLFMLTGDAEAAASAAGEAWLSGSELERLREDCENKLPQAVTHIYRFWMARRSVQTIRHGAPKVGRNDPCPCGSGKKFKKCCAAAQG